MPVSDLESDSDSTSQPQHSIGYINPAMDYLPLPGSPQPLHIISTCGSESNLSSSGYSSMTSPGGSRRGSYHRLCISESEELSTPPGTSRF